MIWLGWFGRVDRRAASNSKEEGRRGSTAMINICSTARSVGTKEVAHISKCAAAGGQQDCTNVMMKVCTRVAGVKQTPEMARPRRKGWVPLEPNSSTNDCTTFSPHPPPMLSISSLFGRSLQGLLCWVRLNHYTRPRSLRKLSTGRSVHLANTWCCISTLGG